MLPDAVLALLLLGPACAVRSCHFCADEESECAKNDIAFVPVKMTCHTFLVKNGPMDKFFRKPEALKASSSTLFDVELPSQNIKTVCMRMHYRFNKSPSGPRREEDAPPGLLPRKAVRRREEPGAGEDPENATFVFQSCMYEKVAGYNTPCEYMSDRLAQNYYELKTCSICRRHLCNRCRSYAGRGAIVLVVVVVVVALALLP